MTYTENVTAMTADGMAGVLSGDGPDALSPMVVTALPDPALPETGKRVIAAERQAAVSAFARDALGRGRREPVFWCAQGDRAAIEFAETSSDGSRRSSIVTMELATGSITRIVAFWHSYVPRLAGPAPPRARRLTPRRRWSAGTSTILRRAGRPRPPRALPRMRSTVSRRALPTGTGAS